MLGLHLILSLFWLAPQAWCKVVYLNWTLTWVNAAPDGFQRPVIGINGEWPCPQVDLEIGDRLIADVYNGLGNQSSSIHWHGIRQEGTNEMDGANSATQCPIPPGQSMRYDFRVNQVGTYWYHSHQMGQYPDGLRGPLIIRGKEAPPFDYDEEITVTVSDWYHQQTGALLHPYRSENREKGGLEPLPNAVLFNEATDTKLHVQPGKTYLIRIICVGNWAGHSIFFEDHDMTIVEVDGVYVEPTYVPPKLMRVAPGHRMSVLITTKTDTSRNYGILDAMDIQEMFLHVNRSQPPGFSPNGTAWLVYDEEKPLPPAPDIHVNDPSVDFLNDIDLVPIPAEPLLAPVNRQIILNMSTEVIDGIATYTVNGDVYNEPEIPTLYTAINASPEEALDPELYGTVNPFVVQYGEIVEIVINNFHSNLHAWHLHGRTFQVVQRTNTNGGPFERYEADVPAVPVRRDTLMVEPNGHLVLRLKATNPDKFYPSLFRLFHADCGVRVWLLHCHTEFHVMAHLSATIIEAPDRLQGHEIPEDHLDLCPASVLEHFNLGPP